VPAFEALARLVAMADDNDRWLHRVPGSRELAWVVRALGADAFGELLQVDATVGYTPRMQEARDRVEAEIAHSLAVAEASRTERQVGDVTVVTAVCDGHPSEVADKWGKVSRKTVIALWDARSLGISFRRSPDCSVDLSHVAERLGGGGHAAAAGAEVPDLRRALAEVVAGRVAEVLE
jgi:nanoRNase/pAp phosphatase (c-di-AMP/oligoRNAs hydrolase)